MPSPKLTRQRRPRGIREQALGPWPSGVNEKAEPHALEFSELSGSGNIMTDEDTGKTSQRPGSKFDANVAELDNPVSKCYNFIKRDGTEIALLTDGKKLVTTQDFVIFTDITPAAFLTDGEFSGDPFFLDFATGFDKVWITNGVDSVFSWDGVIAGNPGESLVAHDKGTTEIIIDGADSTSSIIDPLLDRAGDGTTWVGQLLVVTSAVDDGIIGVTRKVLTFDDATDTITFDEITGLVNGDKVLVGVAIPRGRYVAVKGNIFFAATPENQSEFRFNDDTDPNEPSLTINPDNPNAWPSERQLDSGDGDRIWGFTPVYRDRLGAMKSSKLTRIEPDPVFIYRLVEFESQFGSRFPNTWQKHGNVLMFLGEDKDGLPDVFMTDFVTTREFKRKHRDTLDSLQQASSIFRSRILNSKSEFDAGLKSTGVDTSAGKVAVGKATTKSQYESRIASGLNIDLESDPGKVSVLGAPVWTERYEADVLPGAADPAWSGSSSTLIGATVSIIGGVLVMDNVSGGNSNWIRERPDHLSSAKDTLVCFRARASGPLSSTLNFGVQNGEKGVVISLHKVFPGGDGVEVNQAGFGDRIIGDVTAFHNYTILLKENGNFKIWKDGVLLSSGTAPNSTQNRVFITPGVIFQTVDADSFSLWQFGDSEVDSVYTHTDFKGDSLSSLGGKVDPLALPDILPLTGNIVLTDDYAKEVQNNPTIHSLGKLHIDFDLRGQASSIETQTSPDDGVYSGFIAHANNTLPFSPIARFLQTKVNLASNVLLSSVFQGLQPGIIYLTPPILIGAEIKAWDIQQISRNFVSGAFNTKIRRATSASLLLAGIPVPNLEAEPGWVLDPGGAQGNATDAEGWLAVNDGDNIGTILGGVNDGPNPPDPDGLWVQIKVEADVDNFDDVNEVISIIENWREGSARALPTSSVMFKKRWLMTGATVESAFNNVVVTVDSNRSFNNWNGLNTNCFFLYRGKLLAFDSDSQDVIELVDGLLSDDDGEDGIGGRNIKPILAFVESRADIGGAIHEWKRAHYYETMASTVDQTILFSAKRETETDFSVINSVTYSPTRSYKRLIFSKGFNYRRLSLRAENGNLNEGFDFEGIILGYERVPGRGHRG